MRTDTVYKRTFNRTLDMLTRYAVGRPLMSENLLKERLKASRTTIRKVINMLETQKIISGTPGNWIVLRAPHSDDYFPETETVPTSAQVEKMFLEWMLRGDRLPGDVVNGLELARQFGVSTGAIREYLNRFSRYSLIERRPNSSWIIRGFTRDFALELFEVRQIFELRSALSFARLPETSDAWQTLRALEAEHLKLLESIAERYHDFSDLDERLHRLINSTSGNRFIVDFHDIISLIFHYHYQWSKVDERERNQAAIGEHLAYIEALFSRDAKRIERACQMHLASARKTLLASILMRDG